MNGKEFIHSLITSFFSLVTLITIAMLILGFILEDEQTFGYEAYAFPLIYGAIGTISQGIMYSKRELTLKAVIVRKVIQLLFIVIVIPVFAFGGSDILATRPELIVGMVVSIIVIFVVSHIIDWVMDSMSAKKMTEELVMFQESVR